MSHKEKDLEAERREHVSAPHQIPTLIQRTNKTSSLILRKRAKAIKMAALMSRMLQTKPLIPRGNKHHFPTKQTTEKRVA